MRKTAWIFSILLSFAGSGALAQDLQKDWYELYRLVSDPKTLEIRMQSKVYFVQDEERSEQEPMTLETHIRISDGMYYFRNNDYEMLINRSYVITVLYTEKIVMLADNAAEYVDKYRKIATENTPFSFGGLKGIRTSYLGADKDARTYLVQGEDTEIQEARISFNANGPGLRSISYIYNPESETGMQSMHIDFSVFDSSPVFPEGAFSESKFFSRASGKPVLTPAFTGFQLITLNSYEK